VKTWDVIVVGGGIIGLSLSIALRKQGLRVLVVERGEPGREASHAAAGMLADCMDETPSLLQPLATASARMYPEFVHELRDESGIDPDLREQGTIVFHAEQTALPISASGESLSSTELVRIEPAVAGTGAHAIYLNERSVDPRKLLDISSGSTVTELLTNAGRAEGVATARASYHSPVVVNCAGAWAGQISSHHFPTRPVKGQMLSVVGQPVLKHVIRTTEIYLVPRSDGRILVGATVEEAGYDKRTDAETIHRMHQAAVRAVPALKEARILEDWAGLRPGTPDDLPILGATSTPGYFVATGHFRNGILLAPVTAHLMTRVITGEKSELDLAAFSPNRFQPARLSA
jgi:glycine oxidase